ncbi:uncharacterized protein BYT42DRAFT_554162 [Radiomyces spectabilis]|uniref:uncharacterized protein n=1 Tax=Radiomyces spectabilis TaxID=64574 RepID=UPI0022200549|nr:uncharacterized protein BYT42DRAFT_554162 [Radiomyces spectabilis]KAI8394305.1 hypothetical protein BYT42DRAFT_554162 [Radiomyces spectabilis]
MPSFIDFYRSTTWMLLYGIVRIKGAAAQEDFADDGDDNDDDSCAFISSQTCGADDVCKFCAMCLQSSCILSKYIPPLLPKSGSSNTHQVCNTTQFGTTNIYAWYDYCLSSGNDNSGNYCATSSKCYQYRKTSNATVTYAWQNLTCDPSTCMLASEHGLPPPVPGQLLPPDTQPDPTQTHPYARPDHGNHPHRQDGHGYDFAVHSPAAIALIIACSCTFVGCLIWIGKLWKQSEFWPRVRLFGGSQRPPSTSSTPSTAPPSFSSNAPDMAQTDHSWGRPSLSHSTSSSQQPSSQQEAPPSYYHPDPPPPKYEHAIVTQIRGIQTIGETDSSVSASVSNDHEDETNATDHRNALGPPLWVPVYFTPNNPHFTFGRLRRHPPSSSTSAWNNEWTDPMRAFWFHHQQQMQQQNPAMWRQPLLPSSTDTVEEPSSSSQPPPSR